MIGQSDNADYLGQLLALSLMLNGILVFAPPSKSL